MVRSNLNVGSPRKLGIVLLLFAALISPAGAWGAGGDLLWDDQFDKGDGFLNEALAIAVQGRRVYVAGRGLTTGFTLEWVVRAYDAGRNDDDDDDDDDGDRGKRHRRRDRDDDDD